MIVALHVATGAVTGALTRSRTEALALGPPLHAASDRVPHRHPHWSLDCLAGAVALALVAERRGVMDAATVGALAAVAPDLKHLRPRATKRRGRRRRQRGLSVGAQLVLTTVMLAALLVRPRTSEPA